MIKDRSLLVVIDNFSYRALEYDNVTLFDYGILDQVAFIDNYYDVYTGQYSGYGTYDDQNITADYGAGFYQVSADGDSWDNATVDLDFLDSGSFVDTLGNTAYYDEFRRLIRLGQSPEATVNHGDWVVEAINQTLDSASSTEILAIDVDLGSSNFFGQLFQTVNYVFDGLTYTGSTLEKIVSDFFQFNDSRFSDISTENFALAGISMSIAGTPPNADESAVLESLESYGIPFFQSAPNVNNGKYDWSILYEDVVSVGAWNQNNTGALLVGSETSLTNLDIVADGTIEKAGWGTNFGTSFATPKVAAEWVNVLNDAIEELNASGSNLEALEAPNLENFDYSDFVNSIINTISTPIRATINGSVVEPIAVLSNTIEENGYLPKVAGNYNGLDYSVTQASAYDENTPATFSSPTFSGSLITGTTVSTSISYSDQDGNADGIIFTGWFLDDGDLNNGIEQHLTDYTSLDGEIILDAAWTGKTLYFSKGFEDDLGNLETSWDGTSVEGLYRVGEITAANSVPTGNSDTTPPELVSLSLFSSATTEAGYDGIKIVVRAVIHDDLSGNAGEGYSSSPSQIRLLSPSGEQLVDLMLDGSHRIINNAQSGTYEDSIILPQFAEAGDWTVESILLVDQVGNMTSLSSDDLAATGFQTSVTVAGDGPADTTGIFELSDLDGTNGFQINGVNSYDYSGFSVSSAGDMNGDGIDDIIIAASNGYDYEGSAKARTGESYVVFGSENWSTQILELSDLDGTNGFQINGINGGGGGADKGGTYVSSAGDVNGDGVDDIIIGASLADPNSKADAGESYVVFGSENWSTQTLELSDLDGTNGFKINGISSGDRSGRSVSSAGDVNGDGLNDIIVGALNGSDYVVFGSENWSSQTLELSDLNGTNGFRIDGINRNDNSRTGTFVSSAGDVNGDGIDDFVLGASSARGSWDKTYGFGSGESYVVFGSENWSSRTLDLSELDGTNGFQINGVNSYDYSGSSVSSGDVNGDGINDIIIGAPGADPSAFANSGEVYVVFGSENWSSQTLELSDLNGTNGFKINGFWGNDHIGAPVSSGDVNGDGVDDVIIGQQKDGSRETSENYVVFGSENWSTQTLELSDLNGTNGFQINGIDVEAGYNTFHISSAGDVNGDGFGDIVIGAHLADPNGLGQAGESYVVFGQSVSNPTLPPSLPFIGVIPANVLLDGYDQDFILQDANLEIDDETHGRFSVEDFWSIGSVVDEVHYNLYLGIDGLEITNGNVISGKLKFLGVTLDDGPLDDSDDFEPDLVKISELNIELSEYFPTTDLVNNNINITAFNNAVFSGDNIVSLSSNDDLFNGGAGNNVIYGFEGNDMIGAGEGVNYSDGGEGDDTIVLEGNGAFGSGLCQPSTYLLPSRQVPKSA